MMRSLTRQLLEQHGYTVIEANDGQSALSLMESNNQSIDLLLTDVVMRHVSGPELAERLSALRPNLKVIYMSGYTGEMMANREGLKPGVTLIEKPFTRHVLLNTIHTTLG
jgi:DNA-binding NtrC family response regulator